MKEPVLNYEISEHIYKHRLLRKNHHGLWEGKSCLASLFSVCGTWMQLSGREPVLPWKNPGPDHGKKAQAAEEKVEKCAGLTGSQWVHLAWWGSKGQSCPPSHLLWQLCLPFVPVRNWGRVFCRGVDAQVEQHACTLLDVEHENEVTCPELPGQISRAAHPVKETIKLVT